MKHKLCRIGKRIWKDARAFLPFLGIFLVYYFYVHWRYGAYCPLVLLTGFPCAGCGMTRAMLYLISGQPARAVMMHPCVIPVALFLLYCFFFRYIKEPRPEKGQSIPGLVPFLLILIAMLMGVYIYRMITVFPNRPPMTYRHDNVMENYLSASQRPDAPQGKINPESVTGSPISSALT